MRSYTPYFPDLRCLGEEAHPLSMAAARLSGKGIHMSIQEMNIKTHIATHIFVQL